MGGEGEREGHAVPGHGEPGGQQQLRLAHQRDQHRTQHSGGGKELRWEGVNKSCMTPQFNTW